MFRGLLVFLLRRTLTVFALALSSFIGPFGGQMIVPVLTEAAEYFKVPDVIMGLAITLYMIPFAIFQFFSAFFSYRFGAKKVMVGGTFLYALASLALYFQSSFYMFLLLRVLQGFGSGLMIPVSMAYVGRSFEPELRGRVFGAMTTAVALGGIAGSILGGLSGGIDWRLIFIWMSISGFLAATSLEFFIYSEDKQETYPLIESISRYKHVLSSWLILAIGFSGASIFFTRFSLNTFISITVKKPPYNLTPEILGGILSLAGWGGFLSGPISGYLTDRFGRRSTILAGFTSMLFLNFFYLTDLWFELLAPIYFLFGFSSSMAFTGLNTFIVEAEREYRDEATSVYGSMRFAGYALGPVAPIGLYNMFGLMGVAILNILVLVIVISTWTLIKLNLEKRE